MKILIVEDDDVSSTLLSTILAPLGDCDVAIDGESAVSLFEHAHQEETPYDILCIDIMLPGLDGQNVLKRVRLIEERRGIMGLAGVKIVMITALGDHTNIMEAFRSQCEGYIVKPIRKEKVLTQLRTLGFMGRTASQTRLPSGDEGRGEP
jgi:two-component system chemotaxis response regulator CheY